MIGVLGATGRIGLADRGVEAPALVRTLDHDLPLPAVHAGLAATTRLSRTIRKEHP